jgi:hypothetical protein
MLAGEAKETGMTVAADIQKVQVHLVQNATQVLVLLMAEVDARLKMKSPVLSGRLRASWTIGIGQLDTSVAPEVPPAGSIATPEPRIPAITLGSTIYHGNSLPYARRIEYGYSKKAPAGMVRVTAAEIPSIISALVAQVGGT